MNDKTSLFVVEGKDEINFFKSLIDHMGLTNCKVEEGRGKYNYKAILPSIIKSSGFFEEYKSLGIIRDADDNCQSSFQSIIDILKKIKAESPYYNITITLPKIPYEVTNGTFRVGIYIMPGNNKPGMLEDLCLEMIKNKPIFECMNKYFECLSTKNIDHSSNSKSKCKVYLASMSEATDCIGIGAKKHYWDFNSPELTQLKSFINSLCK